ASLARTSRSTSTRTARRTTGWSDDAGAASAVKESDETRAEAAQVAHDHEILVPSRTDPSRVYWMYLDEIRTLGGVVAKVNGLERFEVVGNVIYAARSEHIAF